MTNLIYWSAKEEMHSTRMHDNKEFCHKIPYIIPRFFRTGSELRI